MTCSYNKYYILDALAIFYLFSIRIYYANTVTVMTMHAIQLIVTLLCWRVKYITVPYMVQTYGFVTDVCSIYA